MTSPPRPSWPLLALLAIVIVTVGWWAGALWPLPAATPEWVVRARAACFGSTASGLPNSGGWILLIGTPLSLFAALLFIAGDEVRSELGELRRSRWGGWVVAGSTLALLMLLGTAGLRISAAYGLGASVGGEPLAADGTAELRRLDSAAPPLRLVDQRGEIVTLEELRGRPVLVTFAYGKCGTVCPVVVRNVLAARDEAREVAPAILIVTLDPWRDTPTRLAHIAESWEAGAEDRLLGGSVAEVEATLDDWGVERVRDTRTGEIAHASLVYVVDREGRIAFAVTGSQHQIVAALRQL